MGAGEVAWFIFMEMDCFALCYFMCRKKHDGWLCDGMCGVVSFGGLVAKRVCVANLRGQKAFLLGVVRAISPFVPVISKALFGATLRELTNFLPTSPASDGGGEGGFYG